jgi:WD40 repeat protein
MNFDFLRPYLSTMPCLSALFPFLFLLLPQRGIVWTAAWSHNDRYVAIGNDRGELAIYETKSWKKKKAWRYEGTTITRVEWNPRYPLLAVASTSHAGRPAVVQLYDLEKDAVLLIRPDSLQGRGVSWSPDGETVALVGREGRISLFSREGRLRKTLSFSNPGALFDIDWHPTESLLVAVEESIYLIDPRRDSVLAVIDDGSAAKGILSVQWHPSGRQFVTGDYGQDAPGSEPSYLRRWTKEGTLLKQGQDSRLEYRNLRWSADGRLAAAGEGLLLYNREGKLVRKVRLGSFPLWGLDWSHQGNRLITSDGGGWIRIVDGNGKVEKAFRF